MASLRRHPKSPFYFACFTLPDGRQTQRSTKTTERKLALKIAAKYEEPTKRRISESQARRVIADIYELHNHEPLTSANTGAFLRDWLDRKQTETQPNTFAKYRSVIEQFVKFLGDKAASDLNFITRRHVADFQQSIAKRLTPATANLAVKILRVAFKQAYRDGLIQVSPADQVKVLANRNDERERRPFTPEELRAIFRNADGEWQGMLLFGLYTGQRLKDIATLTSSNIDLETAEVRLTTAKTQRRQLIPLHPQLLEFIIDHLLNADIPNAPLFPRAYAAVEKSGAVQTISNSFYELLVATGLARVRSKANTGRGRSVRRKTNPLSFHSLRHTLTSLMKNAGVSPAIVQDIVGHDSEEMSRHYTTIDSQSKRKAIAAIPNVLNFHSHR
jgi:integrase